MTEVTTAQEIDKVTFRRDFAEGMMEEHDREGDRDGHLFWRDRWERFSRELAVLRRSRDDTI